MEQQNKTDRMDGLMEIARLRFGMIAPVIQDTYPDESVMAKLILSIVLVHCN